MREVREPYHLNGRSVHSRRYGVVSTAVLSITQIGGDLFLEKNMARIIVEPASTGNDLSQRFVKALNLLNEKGIKLHSGTKLVSKYAVIVAEDPSKALEHLRAGNITAFVEP
jgi:hypothetical protein